MGMLNLRFSDSAQSIARGGCQRKCAEVKEFGGAHDSPPPLSPLRRLRGLRKPVINLTLTAVNQTTLITCPNCPIRPLSPIAARKADHLVCPIQYHPIQDFAFHISFRPALQLFWRRQKSLRNESALFRPRYSPAKSDVGSTTPFQ